MAVRMGSAGRNCHFFVTQSWVWWHFEITFSERERERERERQRQREVWQSQMLIQCHTQQRINSPMFPTALLALPDGVNLSHPLFFPPDAILLGFEHYLVMLGTTVIIPTAFVPQMGGGNEEKAKVIQTLLFVAGLNTLLQTTFGTILPAAMGGSYTFVAATISIILSGRFNDQDPIVRFKRTMQAIQGALIVASTLQIVLGFSGLWRNVTRFLSPLSAVPLVAIAGFGFYEFGFPGVAKCIEIGLPQLILVFISQYLAHVIKRGKDIFERFEVVYLVAIV